MKSLEAKIVVLGCQGVGKTSIVVRYVADQYNKHVNPTIGASFFTCKMMLDNFQVKMQVWDTAGQERFRSMAPMYYRKSNVALLVYDVASEDSFQEIKTWITELNKNVQGHIIYLLIGNKCDLVDSREVSKTEAEKYAASIGAKHFQTSALNNEGIQDVFYHIGKKLIQAAETPNSGVQVLDHDRRFSTSQRLSTSAASSTKPEPSRGGCCS